MAECLEGDPNAVFEEEGKTNLKAFKIWVTIIFFIICFAGLVPKVWKGCANNDTALSLLNCFSGGLFLAMALVHMMPEGTHLYEDWAKKAEIEDPFPLPYATFFLGYLLVLLVDRVIAKSCGGHSLEKLETKKNSVDKTSINHELSPVKSG